MTEVGVKKYPDLRDVIYECPLITTFSRVSYIAKNFNFHLLLLQSFFCFVSSRFPILLQVQKVANKINIFVHNCHTL